MKQYASGLIAVIIAYTLTAFENQSLATKDFRFVGNPAVQSEVEDPHRWTEVTSLVCQNSVWEIPCVIAEVDEAYYHQDGSGTNYLNNSSDAGGTELAQTITA